MILKMFYWTTIDNIQDIDPDEQKIEIMQIEIKFNEWIAKKGFTKQELTIEYLSLQFSTNRTYLSSYINATYNLSFRE